MLSRNSIQDHSEISEVCTGSQRDFSGVVRIPEKSQKFYRVLFIVFSHVTGAETKNGSQHVELQHSSCQFPICFKPRIFQSPLKRRKNKKVFEQTGSFRHLRSIDSIRRCISITENSEVCAGAPLWPCLYTCQQVRSNVRLKTSENETSPYLASIS